ncbi:IS4 family transposase [Lentzea sp. BCCO 10_0856]|uniref:IS4 family transposase n=1 Tax=Lentzea miocenica TaxID=3095431 RepID=A0ABU4TCT4_9PSEU|nr:IS4 family transposase [Lentzea sp. BCCO 10_0856]MDX8035875.1 IS4 family transposase [Lentzea sp. BCCO 10_0856]
MAGVEQDAGGLPERVAIGVLTTVFPPALVDEVIEQAQARELRKRSLPARLTLYFTLALWLFRGRGYDLVLRNLVDGLAFTRRGWGDWRVPSTGSITKARARLGPAPLEALFRRVAGPVGARGAPGVFWRGLRLVCLDGTGVEVPDSDANRAVFGRPSGKDGWIGPYPQVTVVALAECGTHALLDAAFGGYRTGEQDLAAGLASALRQDMLVLADRNFPGGPLWTAMTGRGAQLLWRIKTGQFALPVEQVLPDGTYLSSFTSGKGRNRIRVRMRVLHYTVTSTDQTTGEQNTEEFCLATTLTDPATAPALELAGLYHQRWQAETLFAELKTTQRGGALEVLRSHSPDGVAQEIWAMLCVHHALRGLMATTAHATDTPALHISFTRALDAARRTVTPAAAFPPPPGS